jgi:hypothetical protein
MTGETSTVRRGRWHQNRINASGCCARSFLVCYQRPIFRILNELSALAAEAFVGEAISRRWLSVLERAALAIFDDVAPIQDILLRNFATKNGTVKNWLVEGRRQLVSMLRGYGPRGVELFKNLQLPVPETKKKEVKAP